MSGARQRQSFTLDIAAWPVTLGALKKAQCPHAGSKKPPDSGTDFAGLKRKRVSGLGGEVNITPRRST